MVLLQQGWGSSQIMLGIKYYYCVGVSQNYVKAYLWKWGPIHERKFETVDAWYRQKALKISELNFFKIPLSSIWQHHNSFVFTYDILSRMVGVETDSKASSWKYPDTGFWEMAIFILGFKEEYWYQICSSFWYNPGSGIRRFFRLHAALLPPCHLRRKGHGSIRTKKSRRFYGDTYRPKFPPDKLGLGAMAIVDHLQFAARIRHGPIICRRQCHDFKMVCKKKGACRRLYLCRGRSWHYLYRPLCHISHFKF